MREQATFFDQQFGEKRIVVLKTYDTALAREAFDQMTPLALEVLVASLDLSAKFEPSDIPASNDIEFPEFIWNELADGAREDWDSFSYFIVREMTADSGVVLYVSSDWPSAEAFAKSTLPLPA